MLILPSISDSLTIRDLPLSERPRERLLCHGAEQLSLQELLAILLGRGIRGESVLLTARRLLARFDTPRALLEASAEDLQSVRGIGPAKAAQLKACFALARHCSVSVQALRSLSETASVVRILESMLLPGKKERFAILCLDSRQRLIRLEEVSVGTLDAALVHPREVFSAALRVSSHSIILAHNHPSGCPQPSKADIQMTTLLRDAGHIIGIPVRDHVIVADEGFYSFKDNNLL